MLEKLVSRLARREELVLTRDLVPFTPFSALIPPECLEGLYIGVDEYDRQVYIDLSRLPSAHGIVTGPTGSGKSTFIRHLVLEAVERGINAIFIDPHGEAREFVVSVLGGEVVDMQRRRLDILEVPPGATPAIWAEKLADGFQYVYNLLDVQASRLRELLEKAIANNDLSVVISELEEQARFDAYALDLLSKVKPALSLFKNPNLSIRDVLESDRPLALVFRTEETPPMPVRSAKVLAWVLLGQIDMFQQSRGVSHTVEKVVVLDEAHRLLQYGGEYNIAESIFRESRKFGYGLWILSQHPQDFSVQMYQNAAFKVFLPGPEEYVRNIAGLVEITSEDADFLMYNVKGTCLLVRAGDPRPRRVFLKLRKEAFISSPKAEAFEGGES